MKSCPAPEQLENLLEGLLEEKSASWVSRHVERCKKCQAILERLTISPTTHQTIQLRQKSRTSQSEHGSQADFLQRIKEAAAAELPESNGTNRSRDDASVPLPEVDGYETQRELGRGGIGVVYLARQLSLNRLVALKVLRSGPHADAEERERFRQEAETVARLRHPNVVHVYEVGEQDGSPYLAMEYVEGGSLRERLRGDPQPFITAVSLVETIARAVHHAHQAGLIHRDLKPANVLLQPPPYARDQASIDLAEYVPRITDFGLAKQLDDLSHRTATGEIVGTPCYMAPEQAASGRGALSPATDTYALGAILYEFITGRPPFKGATTVDTIVHLLHQDPPRPSSLRPDVPRDLETICMTCLNKEPARRYSSAAALADDLSRFRRGQPIQARPIGMAERGWKWAKAHPLTAALLAGIVLVTLLGFAGITWQWRAAVLAGRLAWEEQQQKEQERAEAEFARTEAAIQRREARQALYGSRIAQSQLSWRVNDLTGARRALESCIPSTEEEDRRGWEWFYLHQLYRSEAIVLEHSIDGLGGAICHSVQGELLGSVLVNADPDAEGELILWNLQGRQQIWRRSLQKSFHRLCFSPDDKCLALGSMDGWVMLCNTIDGSETIRWKAHDTDVTSVEFSPEGDKLLTASWDHRVRLWSARDGRLLQQFEGHEGRIQSAGFLDNGKTIASASWDRTIRLWSIADGTCRELRGHKAPIFALAISPDSKYLASGAQNGNIRIWEVAAGRIVQSFNGVSGAILHLAFSPDGRYLAYGGGDATVRIWDFKAGTHKGNLRGHTSPIEGLSFHPNGQTLTSCCPREGAIVTWDMTRNPESAHFAHTEASVDAVAFDLSRQKLLTLTVRGQLQSWDRRTGVPIAEHSLLPPSKTASIITTSAFSGDGKLVAAVTQRDSQSVRVWNTATREIVNTLEIDGKPTCLDFSPETRSLAIGGERNGKFFLLICSLDNKSKPLRFDLPARPHVVSFRDEHSLGWGGARGRIGFVDLKNPQSISARLHRGKVTALAFSPDCKTLASAGESNRKILLSRLVVSDEGKLTFVEAATLETPTELYGLAFSPDGKRLAGISREVVKIWDPRSRLEILTLRGSPQPFWEGTFSPRILFSPDGTALAATNWDNFVSLWDSEPPITNGSNATNPSPWLAERSLYWHLTEAEQCLAHNDTQAARFHLERLNKAQTLSTLVQARRDVLLKRLAEQESKQD